MGMLVLMLGIEDAYGRMEQSETKTALEENIDEIRRLSAQGAATVVMSIAKTLPTIVNPAAVGDPDDAVEFACGIHGIARKHRVDAQHRRAEEVLAAATAVRKDRSDMPSRFAGLKES